MGVLLYAVFIGSVNLKCLFLKHAEKDILQISSGNQFLHRASWRSRRNNATADSFCLHAG